MNTDPRANDRPSDPLSRYSGGGLGWGPVFRHSDFVLRICFGFLISGFGFSARAQVPADRPPAANAPVDNILNDLYERGRSLKDFTADVSLAETDPITAADRTRTGHVYYQVKPDGDTRIRVSFDTFKTSGPPAKERLEYLLDNGVLVDQNFHSKLQVTRQVLKPGQKLNPLKLGEGPFPLPIGQPPEEVHKQFDVKLVPPSKDDPAGTTHATLTPKPDTRLGRRFATIDVWVSQKDKFPVRIETTGKTDQKVQTTELTNLKVNTGLSDADFKLPEPGKDWGVRNEELGE